MHCHLDMAGSKCLYQFLESFLFIGRTIIDPPDLLEALRQQVRGGFACAVYCFPIARAVLIAIIQHSFISTFADAGHSSPHFPYLRNICKTSDSAGAPVIVVLMLLSLSPAP